MKSILSVTAVAITIAAPAFAFFPMGNDAELFVTGDATLEYNTNVFLGEDARSDTILTLAPGIQIPFGQNSAAKGTLTAFEEFQMFATNDDLNDQLAKVNLDIGFDNGKSTAKGRASYAQINQANRDTAGGTTIARRDVSGLGFVAEISATAKSSVGFGINWDETAYKLPGYADLETFEVPLKYYYQITPQVDVSAGARYKKNKVDSIGADSEETFYSLGARGDLLPKLTGEFSVGLNQRERDVGPDNSSLGLESSFTYGYSQKTSFTFGANSRFGYSGSGAAYDILGADIAVHIAAQQDLSFDASLGYTEYDYTSSTRKDNMFTSRIGGSYVLNAYLTLKGSVAYTNNDSNFGGSSFKGTIFTVAGSFRY